MPRIQFLASFKFRGCFDTGVFILSTGKTQTNSGTQMRTQKVLSNIVCEMDHTPNKQKTIQNLGSVFH